MDTNQTGQLKYTDINRVLRELSQSAVDNNKNIGIIDGTQGSACIAAVENTHNQVENAVESTDTVDNNDETQLKQVLTYLLAHSLTHSLIITHSLTHDRTPTNAIMTIFSIGKRTGTPRIPTAIDTLRRNVTTRIHGPFVVLTVIYRKIERVWIARTTPTKLGYWCSQAMIVTIVTLIMTRISVHAGKSTHSLLLTHSLTRYYSLTHSLTHSLTYSLTTFTTFQPEKHWRNTMRVSAITAIWCDEA